MKVLAGICGGVAAYKALEVVSRLRQSGHEVTVAMTEAGQKFVTPSAFAAVSGRPVTTSVFPEKQQTREDIYPHLYPASEVDVFMVLPATADIMAKLVAGIADDPVCASALALPPGCLKLFAQAMNTGMWKKAVVQSNVAALEKDGWVRVGPNDGALACGVQGPGRMAEPAEIISRFESCMADSKALQGQKILILSGPTREHLDPVRFISNASSGRMGKALAEAAVGMGATVEFVTGPVDAAQIPAGNGLVVHRVVSARDMLETARALYAGADAVVYAAAVADFSPAEPQASKLPKTGHSSALALNPTPDIAAELNGLKKAGQVAVGFALQTGVGENEAREKLKKKNFDAVVLNHLDALGGESGSYQVLKSDASCFEDWGTLSKPVCARKIMDFIRTKL